MKEIAVLLAAYNGARYLPEQLVSLRTQDDPLFHVLMQDDGSHDDTMMTLLQLCAADGRFQMGAEQGKGYGAVGNFWSLLNQCQAPYIALCDQDDRWHTDRLSRCRQAMERAEKQYGEETPLLVHSDCSLIGAEGQPLHASFFDHQGWDRSATGFRRLLVQNNVTGCTILMNAALKDLAIRYGDFEKMVMHDWFLALTAAAFGHVIMVDAPLVDYRQHGDNVQGASRQGQIQRGVKALSKWQKGKARIQLTYDHAKNFAEMYGAILPEQDRKDIAAYLATQKMKKLQRVTTVQRQGFTMQSIVTRAGQIVFG